VRKLSRESLEGVPRMKKIKKDKYTFQYEYADEIGRETNHKITFNATTIDEICCKLRDFLKGCGFSFDEIGVIDYDKEDEDEKV